MRHALFLPLVALAACATNTAPVVAEPAAPDAGICRNDALATFVGKPATQALGAQMLAASGARTLRWVEKGMMVTMDFRDDRLTVHLDANNRVETARCG